jgi:hypothetical protein
VKLGRNFEQQWTFLENGLPLHIGTLAVATPTRMWLQFVGLSPHLGRALTGFLNEDMEEEG